MKIRLFKLPGSVESEGSLANLFLALTKPEDAKAGEIPKTAPV